MRERLEFIPVWLLLRGIGILPRPLARAIGISLAYLVYALHSRLRRVGLRNLQIAFPEMPLKERRRLLRGEFRNLGRLLAEFCLFPRYTRENVNSVMVYEGFENYQAAARRGKGVLVLTAHFGGWEIGSFAHSLLGHTMNIVIRPLDNPYIHGIVEKYRRMHGNRTIGKQDFARGLVTAARRGEAVGILMDTNMTPPQGVFVPFFGVPACTASGMARVALHTDAAVVPGFTVWDAKLGRYRVRFDPALPLVRTGNDEADAIANTATFTKVIEDYARRYPDQWLWVHRRWKTRPAGEPPLY